MAESGAATFTEAVAELEAAGFTSAGFGIEDGTIVCMECGGEETVADVAVGGMLRYQNAAGEGHVFALGCILYSITRFTIEYLRNDELGQFGTSLTISQWVSIGILITGLGVLATLNGRRDEKLSGTPATSVTANRR